MENRSKGKIIHLEVYTDGSLKKSLPTMTFGGWSFIVLQDTKKIYDAAGSEVNTTNQRMELEAIRKGLEYVSTIRRPNEHVIIYSDSAYAINCYLQEWYINWQHNGWINTSKQPVANQDLWYDIIPYFDNFWYDFRKVKGHGDNYWNIKCDEMAQAEAEKLRLNWRGYNEKY